jgi:hypothetical protein
MAKKKKSVMADTGASGVDDANPEQQVLLLPACFLSASSTHGEAWTIHLIPILGPLHAQRNDTGTEPRGPHQEALPPDFCCT